MINYNGIYNGLNLAGLDIARLYLALHNNPAITVPAFLQKEEIFYTIALPRSPNFELPRLYPWMVTKPAEPETRSWKVSFARSGLPLKIEPSQQAVAEPMLVDIEKSTINYADLTRGYISGHGKRAHLADSGKKLAQLLIYTD